MGLGGWGTNGQRRYSSTHNSVLGNLFKIYVVGIYYRLGIVPGTKRTKLSPIYEGVHSLMGETKRKAVLMQPEERSISHPSRGFVRSWGKAGTTLSGVE